MADKSVTGAAAVPTMKAIEAISMLAFCESSWSPHNSDGWTIFSSTSSIAYSGNGSGSLTNTDTSGNSDSIAKSVRFSTIEVREYPITIGDSLCVAVGVPHTIEWDHLQDQTKKMNVDLYERKRPNQRRRQGESLILDSLAREKKLLKVGFTTQDLLDAIQAREVALRTLYC
jgi:hypothetical protein